MAIPAAKQCTFSRSFSSDFLLQGYTKLCEKWRLSVGAVPVSHTREEKESKTSTLIDYLSEEVKTTLRRREEEVRLARLSGNVFEARVREKRLKKAMTRVQSLTAKLNKDNTEQEVSKAECEASCKQQPKSSNFNPPLTSYAFRQALVQQVIPE